jgi:hypothetical protein
VDDKNDDDNLLQEGPIGLVAMIVDEDGLEQHNPQAAPIIRECIDAFESFEHDLRKICPDQLLHVIPAEAPHICIAIFRGHCCCCSIIPERASYAGSASHHDHTTTTMMTRAPMKESTVDALQKSLNQTFQTLRPCKIILQLDSILLTPDGAMIAGFVPIDDEDHQTTMDDDDAYGKLQMAVTETAISILGGGPPNNLTIHVTLGRILGFGDEHLLVREKQKKSTVAVLPQRQQSAIRELVRRYNQEILPQTVTDIRRRMPAKQMGTFQLRHVSLLRNVVWFCEENIFYQTWDISSHHPTFQETTEQ